MIPLTLSLLKDEGGTLRVKDERNPRIILYPSSFILSPAYV